jgi:predicted nuclease of predicted toxin-antitoxin system
MALQSSFKFTNDIPSVNDVQTYAIGLVSNYAVVTDDADIVRLDNKTAPVDATELITYRYADIPQVNTKLDNYYPSPVKKGCQYVITDEAMLSTTDSNDASFRVDEPIVAYLSIRHSKSGNITDEHIGTVVSRMLSACRNADGSWRFSDLRRSALKPNND